MIYFFFGEIWDVLIEQEFVVQSGFVEGFFQWNFLEEVWIVVVLVEVQGSGCI